MGAGPDAIKEALAKLGLKTGGTLRQRAERLFLTRDTPLAELDRKNFVKGAAPASLLSPEESARQRAIALEAALLEAKVNVQAPRVEMHYQPQQDACLGLPAGCVLHVILQEAHRKTLVSLLCDIALPAGRQRFDSNASAECNPC